MKLSISNYNIVHKSNTCFSKKGDPLSEYYALEDANRNAAFVSNETGIEMIAYLCTVCNKYHIKPAEYYFNKCDPGDIISIGTIGLIKGIDSYSFKHGTRITTYCARCIENATIT